MKILVVLPRFPYPLEKGDKLRAYHQIVELSKRHSIYLFCVSHTRVTDEQLAALRPYCHEINVVRLNRLVCYWNVVCNRFTSRSLQMGYWFSARARLLYRAFEKQVQPDVVYNQMVRTMSLVSRSKCPKVMDFQDALSMNIERRMDQSRGLWHHILHYEFKMLRSSEYKAFSVFDALTIISETDADAIPHKRNRDITVVANGVDTDYFSREAFVRDGGQPLPPADILFSGNMAYPPNVDAARFLVNEVMPIVWLSCPTATVLLSGTDPKPAVRSLESSRVSVSGRLPDIRAAYAASQLFVAPMRTGSGLQNKLLEAMAMQLPCVTTPIANEPLGAVEGEHILVGSTAEELAAHIVALLQSADRRSQLAAAGHALVASRYSWPTAIQPLENIFNELVSK